MVNKQAVESMGLSVINMLVTCPKPVITPPHIICAIGKVIIFWFCCGKDGVCSMSNWFVILRIYVVVVELLIVFPMSLKQNI